MNRNELIDAMTSKLNVTKKEVRTFLSAYEAAVFEGIKQDEKVVLSGFGSFEKKIIPEHEGRNPATNETIIIPAKARISFKAAKLVKQKIEDGNA